MGRHYQKPDGEWLVEWAIIVAICVVTIGIFVLDERGVWG